MDVSGLFVTDDAPSDDDAISINSTLLSEHDSDEEWLVEGIRAQTREDGTDRYLVEWTGYPIEEATWEPKENMTDELLLEWRDTKARQARGEEEPFDVAAWQEAVNKRQEDKYQRHHERNIKRKRRGLQLKLWEGETEADYYLSDEDIGQNDFNDILPPPKHVERQENAVLSDEREERRPEKSPKLAAVEKPAPQKQTTMSEKTTVKMTEKPRSSKRKASPSISQPRPQPSSLATAINGHQGTVKRPVVSKSTTKAATAAPTQHKARKTTVSSRTMLGPQNSGAGINVFAAGKQIKQRRSLVQNATDSTKGPRMFSNHRIRRKVELQSRDKADTVPGTVPTKLFSISSGPPAGSSSGTLNVVSRSALKHSADGSMASASESSVAFSDIADSTLPKNSESQPTRPMVGKRKSVQFADLPLVNEPESVDEIHPKRLKSPPMPPEPSPPSLSPQKPQPILRKLSITQYQSRSAGQSFDKAVILGPSGTKDIQMTFENVRPDTDPWHSQFVNMDSLSFSRVFTARTFVSQKISLVERCLSHGSVRPKMPHDQEPVDRAAKRLRLGSFGAACFYEDFLIIIYPADCEEWKEVMAEVEVTSLANVTLRYVIYKPQPVATTPLPMMKVIPSSSTEPRTAIFRDLLRFDYRQLLPPKVVDGHHNFYLAFPPSRKLLLDAVSEWLRAENPTCRVFSTKTMGDWAAFTNPKKVTQGVIIVHETATDTLRRFPGLLKLLLHSNSVTYWFWCIGESLQQHPLYPSIRSTHRKAAPGTIELTRLFPHGNAILVTPSFLVSEPRRSLQLFEWYKNTHRKPYNNHKIVAAANIVQYLRDLAFDRSSHRNALLVEAERAPRLYRSSEPRKVATKAGLDQEECAARFETWAIVDGLQPSVRTRIVPDEQLEPIIFVDESIDANDEQSLVNWFGCWSQTRFDQFRKFHVLGTDGSSNNIHFIKDRDIPLYPPDAARDPGAEINGSAHRLDSAVSDLDTIHEPQDNATQIFGGLAAHTFKSKLMDLGKECEGPRICAFGKLYGLPVSYYKDIVNTADSYQDSRRGFSTFDRWIEFSWPFFSLYQPNFRVPNEVRGPTVFNTYFAFFYTPDEDSQSEPPARHPWLAIWRVQAPHIRPWEGTELLIWDIAAKERFPAVTQLYESQLVPAQQHLINLIRERGITKQRGLDLKQVWLGGFESAPAEYTSPIDVTFANLEAMMRDAKGYLPAVESHLASRGFRKVNPGTAPAPKGPIASDAAGIDRISRLQNHGGDTKIIFHPPRAYRPIRPSRYENLFYKWVVNLDKQHQCEAYPYTFKPTVEWYQEQQVAEGRHFEHVNVSSWKRIFELVRITADVGNKKGAGTVEKGKD
ncbi:chromo domain-containing protein [Colletotrichum graminicola]|uniref:Chromo domain-containing protein n=1 Tax=Colletotrichum graminicola (strain M1.001 / M2 / FGSC 10212) TaxID=645133 RepID=E3QPZ5_COLGM|nr:chromo domain-containing protein [Colletotrichum graminicola M1.001]EFQ32933.1 chromo domain-containing protein [Colletotrichum graminicola M1.001]WDK09330.1 chromo domain-containing protein [Colletotrichum graminicola]